MRFPQEEGAHRQRRERVGRVTRVSFPLPFPNLKPTHKRKQKKKCTGVKAHVSSKSAF